MIDFIEKTLESGSKVGNDQSNLMGLPIRQVGSFYELNAAAEDQKDIIAFCVNHLKSFIESEESDTEFVPLQLYVRGVAGNVKSTLINTLVTSTRRICQRSESVLVVGPTGSAAFNAGGTTCHHGLCRPFRPDDGEISDSILKKLQQNLEWTVALIADERSMIQNK
jgi:hypothetical protein